MTIVPEIDARRARTLPFVIAWLLMLLLAGLSLWTAYLAWGIWKPILQFGIAAMQTGFLFLMFMRLKTASSLMWVAAISGFFWLLFLYGLSMMDYGVRKDWPPPHISVTTGAEVPRKAP